MADNDIIDYFSEEDEESDSENETNLTQNVEVPRSIQLNSPVIGISCHPKTNLIAAGTFDGPFLCPFASTRENNELVNFENNRQSCRAVKFSLFGEYLFIGSQDTIIYVIDVERNSEYRRFSRVNASPLYSLLPIDNYLLASGEDDGQVVIWDFRMASPVAVFKDCSDYIKCLAVNKEKSTLLATSYEGVLSAYNIKSRKLQKQSDCFDVEFLSMGITKGDSKVVVGTGDGALIFFNFGEYENISDRFPERHGSVNCMQVISDDLICTGCEDGKIRAVQLFPTRFLGVLGHHNGFPIQSLSLCHDSSLLASSSYEQTIKFWDLSSVEIRRMKMQRIPKRNIFR